VIEFIHNTVMKAAAVGALQPAPEGVYVDGTVGGAGHASAILEASSPTGRLLGFDRDPLAIEVATERLSRFAGRFELYQGNFDSIGDCVADASCDGVLLDLGVSSPQLDQAERGFSFQSAGPLDMRMDRGRGRSAAELVNTLPVEELARLFFEFGEEPKARVMARAIGQRRAARPFETTLELAGLIESVCPRGGSRIHPATRAFQALRIAVNDEMGSLRRGLEAALRCLRPGGRLVVISFHSLEDRVVKEFGRAYARDYTVQGDVDRPEFRVPKMPELKVVTKKPVTADEAELRDNPRSRSAKMRVYEKI